MAESDVRLEIDAKISGLKAKLADAKKSLKSFSSSIVVLDKETVRASKSQDKFVSSNERVAAGARATGGRLGEMVERVQNATVALGPFGAAALLSSAALTATVGAAVALTVAAIRLVKGAAEAAETLGDLADASFEDRKQLESATDALDAMDTSGQQLAITIGAELAPAVEELSRLITKTVLLVNDLADSGLGKATGAAFDFTLKLTGLTRSMEFLDSVTRQYDKDVDALTESLRAQTEATREAKEQTDALATAESRFAEQAGELALLGLEGTALIKERARQARIAADDEIEALEDVAETLKVSSAERELIEDQIRVLVRDSKLEQAKFESDLTAAIESEAEKRRGIAESAVEEDFARLQKRLDVEQQIIAESLAINEAAQKQRDEARDAQAAAEQEAIEAQQAAMQEIDSANQTLHEEELARIEEKKEAERGLRDDAIAAAEMAFGTISDALANVDGAFKATRTAAVAFFRAQQGAAIAQAVISTAEAVIKAFAIFGPPPSPPGIIAAATAGTVGAAQIAKIAGQKPPSFHIGGTIPESAPRLPGGGPRDRVVVGEVGEEMVPAGRGRSPTVVNVIQLGHRLFDAATSQSMESGALQGFGEPETLGQVRFTGGR